MAILEAIAIPALIATAAGAYLTYFYTERAKRAEFRRAAIYERKLAAYEKTVATARAYSKFLIWMLRGWVSGSSEFEKLAESLTKEILPEKRDLVKARFKTFISLVRTVAERGATQGSGWNPSLAPIPELVSLTEDKESSDALRLFLQVIELSAHAESEFEQAVIKLRLLGCPPNLLNRVDSLARDLLGKAPTGPGAGITTQEQLDEFDERVKAHLERLTRAMHDDLEVTIAG